jgi:hypothetical protein
VNLRNAKILFRRDVNCILEKKFGGRGEVLKISPSCSAQRSISRATTNSTVAAPWITAARKLLRGALHGGLVTIAASHPLRNLPCNP